MPQASPLPFDVPADVLARAAKIKLVLFDVDGVLTDGRLFLGDDGQEYKAFYSRDGLGMKALQHSGVELGIITGRTSRVVTHRARDLGIAHVYQGCLEKLVTYNELAQKLGLAPEVVAFVGDDVVDLPIMRNVGLAIAPHDGHHLVKPHAHWIAPHNGGHGAARDVCELIMAAQQTFAAQLVERYR